MMFPEINFDFMVEVPFLADTSFIEGEKSNAILIYDFNWEGIIQD